MPHTAHPKPPSSARALLALTLPVAVGYVPLGAVFGFLFVQAGAPAWWALAAGLLVYAGAAQFMMVPMLAAGLPVASIALATWVVNLRHVFYGLALLDRLPRAWGARAYLAYALTDETYSLLTLLPAHTPARLMVQIAALNQGWWLLGSGLGAWLGTLAHSSWTGLDFSLTALFAVLATEQWRRARAWLPVGLALASYALAWAWQPAHALLLGMALCVGLGGWLARPSQEARA